MRFCASVSVVIASPSFWKASLASGAGFWERDARGSRGQSTADRTRPEGVRAHLIWVKLHRELLIHLADELLVKGMLLGAKDVIERRRRQHELRRVDVNHPYEKTSQ